jgi:molybdenum cofactor cytidylyltransferase
MIFGAAPLDMCEGAIIAHGQTLGGNRVAKGTVLTAAHLDAARKDGIGSLVVARLEAGDIAEDEAAVALGARLAGRGLTAAKPVHGRVNLVATAAGLMRIEAAAVDALNRIDEAITLGTLPPGTRVAAGDVVATIKIIPYAVAGAALEAACAAAVPLAVDAFEALAVALVQTRLPGQPDKLFAKTVDVTAARLQTLGGALLSSGECAHNADSLAAALRTATAPLVLVAGASATVDRRDVIPAAIVAAGGTVARVGMPVDPGNLLCLGEIGGRTVIGLPGCARSPKRNGIDLVLERLAAGLPLDIAGMGVGGLLPEVARPEPRVAARAGGGKVGVIVLAAGRSTRMGAANKLLANLGGKPVLRHVADAVAAAGLPALLVTGHMAEAVRAVVPELPAAHAADYADGLARSLATGIAAVPADWSAAIVALGDMPLVDAALLRRLAAAARADAVVVPVADGKRGNPLAWGRAHFARLATLAGDVGGKALLAEPGVEVIEIDAESDAIRADVDTPSALAALRDRRG